MENRQLFTLNEAADALGISWQTARRWAAAGQIRTIRMGRLVKVPRAEIERLVNEGTAPATEEA